ncbi:unnamed protein product, partial [marine sediment metagenome]
FEQLTSAQNMTFPKLYGDGKAAEFISREIITYL